MPKWELVRNVDGEVLRSFPSEQDADNYAAHDSLRQIDDDDDINVSSWECDFLESIAVAEKMIEKYIGGAK